MDSEMRWKYIEAQLVSHGQKLDDVVSTLQQIAVQQGQIDRSAKDIESLKTKVDAIANWQASCPRANIRWVWVIVIPMGMALLGVASALVKQ